MKHHRTTPPRLVEIAHQILSDYLTPKSWAIDATLGNGHDATFLAERVGPEGKVFAFDLQPLAVEVARMILDNKNCLPWCKLILAGHESMEAHIPSEARGRIQAIMFNLGYLPHGDKTILTKPETTIQALDASMRLLAKNGLLSVIAYRGHQGGEAEFEAVKTWISAQHCAIKVLHEQDSHHSSGNGPYLWVTQRQG